MHGYSVVVVYCIFRHVTCGSQLMTNTGSCHPYQLSHSYQPPAVTAVISMTLQQKVYRLNPIEFTKPVVRELPAYVDVSDPKWARDPRVQPLVQHAAVAVDAGGQPLFSFYSSAAECSGSDSGSVVQQPCVHDADISTGGDVKPICDRELPDFPTNSTCSASERLSEECKPVISIFNANSSAVCVKWDISRDKPENLPKPVVKDPVVKEESVEVTNVASAPVARHAFRHNVSWLSAARSNGVQKLSRAKNGSS